MRKQKTWTNDYFSAMLAGGMLNILFGLLMVTAAGFISHLTTSEQSVIFGIALIIGAIGSINIIYSIYIKKKQNTKLGSTILATVLSFIVISLTSGVSEVFLPTANIGMAGGLVVTGTGVLLTISGVMIVVGYYGLKGKF